MAEFSSYKLELEAQSPLIHFQSNEAGCTIRASEVKPKLDRFLLQKAENKKIDLKDCKIKDRNALDYKMQIIEKGASEIIDLKDYPIFYGNSGNGEENKMKKGVFSNPTVIIIFFHEKLRTLINENIVEFFYVTNFGTMQNKGFGSYKPIIKNEVKEEQIMDWLMGKYETSKAWKFPDIKGDKDKNERCKSQMTWIKKFYGIMKSGQNYGGYERSYLFEYMHKNIAKAPNTENIKKSIDNEKAWMKQNEIAPIYSKDNKNGCDKHDKLNGNSRYVRGFFGMASTQIWQSEKERKNITISGDKAGIERIPSPVYFKIINNNIFFVIENIDDELYDKKFRFKGAKEDDLITPNKSDFVENAFDTVAFMSSYVEYYNKTLANKYFNKMKIQEREKQHV